MTVSFLTERAGKFFNNASSSSVLSNSIVSFDGPPATSNARW